MRPSSPPGRLGVIDSLGSGFALLNRWPWLILIPVTVDLLLWRGPLITPLPLYQQLADAYTKGAGLAPADAQAVAEMRAGAEAALASFNMLTLLVVGFVAAIPALAPAAEGGLFVVPVESTAVFLALGIVLQLGAMFVGCLYFGLLAQLVRDGAVDGRRLAVKLGAYFGVVLRLSLLFLAAVLAVGVPLSIFAALALVAGGPVAQGLLGIAMAAAYTAGLWALVFLYFVGDAVMVSEVRARRAILNSVLVVTRNFWSALAFIILTFVILSGTRIIWSNLGDSVWARVAGIAGNAYIASGLAAASMTFYMSRLAGVEQHGNDKWFLRRR